MLIFVEKPSTTSSTFISTSESSSPSHPSPSSPPDFVLVSHLIGCALALLLLLVLLLLVLLVKQCVQRKTKGETQTSRFYSELSLFRTNYRTIQKINYIFFTPTFFCFTSSYFSFFFFEFLLIFMLIVSD